MSRTRRTDEQKARIIRDFEHSNQSAAAFCRQRGVSYQTLMSWRRRADAKLANPEPASAFLEFELGAPHRWPVTVGPLVELELCGGIILRIHPVRPAQP